MAGIFFRLALVFLVLIYEVTASYLFSGSYQSASAFLGLVIAWTVTSGFSTMMGWIIFAGGLLDIFTFQRFGLSVSVALFTGYAVGFLSRRFLVQHRFWGNVVILGILFFSTALYNGLRVIFLFSGMDGSFFIRLFQYVTSSMMWSALLKVFTINVLLFWIVQWLVEKSESVALFYAKRIRLKDRV